MGLKLESIQAVEMDDKAYLPTITTELGLKLREAKLDTETNRDDAIDIMAECFPGHASDVKKFLKRCALPTLAKLQSYLIAGEDGVKMMERRLDKVNEEVEKKLEEELAKEEEADGE